MAQVVEAKAAASAPTQATSGAAIGIEAVVRAVASAQGSPDMANLCSVGLATALEEQETLNTAAVGLALALEGRKEGLELVRKVAVAGLDPALGRRGNGRDRDRGKDVEGLGAVEAASKVVGLGLLLASELAQIGRIEVLAASLPSELVSNKGLDQDLAALSLRGVRKDLGKDNDSNSPSDLEAGRHNTGQTTNSFKATTAVKVGIKAASRVRASGDLALVTNKMVRMAASPDFGKAGHLRGMASRTEGLEPLGITRGDSVKVRWIRIQEDLEAAQGVGTTQEGNIALVADSNGLAVAVKVGDVTTLAGLAIEDLVVMARTHGGRYLPGEANRLARRRLASVKVTTTLSSWDGGQIAQSRI